MAFKTKLIGGKTEEELGGTYLSIPEFERYLHKFFKEAVFPIRSMNKTPLSNTFVDAFYLTHGNGLEGNITIEALDSKLVSNKSIVYDGKIGYDRKARRVSGTLGYGFVKKPDRDSVQERLEEIEEVILKKKKACPPPKSLNDSRMYFLDQKEYVAIVCKEEGHYPVQCRANPFARREELARQNAIRDFIGEYISKIKELEED